MALVKFNINNYVYVRLREPGRIELKKQHEELNKSFGGKLGDYTAPKEDGNGWSRWQMHDLMNRFGHMTSCGFDPPFETEIKFEL